MEKGVKVEEGGNSVVKEGPSVAVEGRRLEKHQCPQVGTSHINVHRSALKLTMLRMQCLFPRMLVLTTLGLNSRALMPPSRTFIQQMIVMRMMQPESNCVDMKTRY